MCHTDLPSKPPSPHSLPCPRPHLQLVLPRNPQAPPGWEAERLTHPQLRSIPLRWPPFLPMSSFQWTTQIFPHHSAVTLSQPSNPGWHFLGVTFCCSLCPHSEPMPRGLSRLGEAPGFPPSCGPPPLLLAHPHSYLSAPIPRNIYYLEPRWSHLSGSQGNFPPGNTVTTLS